MYRLIIIPLFTLVCLSSCKEVNNSSLRDYFGDRAYFENMVDVSIEELLSNEKLFSYQKPELKAFTAPSGIYNRVLDSLNLKESVGSDYPYESKTNPGIFLGDLYTLSVNDLNDSVFLLLLLYVSDSYMDDYHVFLISINEKSDDVVQTQVLADYQTYWETSHGNNYIVSSTFLDKNSWVVELTYYQPSTGNSSGDTCIFFPMNCLDNGTISNRLSNFGSVYYEKIDKYFD